MQTFGEQLVQARTAKGMTQDALAQSVNVSRSTVSSWERNRTQPDIETLKVLSDLLDVRFDIGVQFEKQPEMEDQPASQKRRWYVVAGGTAILIFIVLLVLIINRPKAKTMTDSFDLSKYLQITEREEGKAFLVFNNVRWEESGENQVFTRYAFKMYEKNGVGFSIENIELKAESSKRNIRTATYGPDDLRVFNLNPDIEPMGSLNFEGGWPKGEFVRVGITVYGTDSNGNQGTFYSLIEW